MYEYFTYDEILIKGCLFFVLHVLHWSVPVTTSYHLCVYNTQSHLSCLWIITFCEVERKRCQK